jgi:hypothetical protein
MCGSMHLDVNFCTMAKSFESRLSPFRIPAYLQKVDFHNRPSNLAHGASYDSGDKDAPLKSGIKHLALPQYSLRIYNQPCCFGDRQYRAAGA